RGPPGLDSRVSYAGLCPTSRRRGAHRPATDRPPPERPADPRPFAASWRRVPVTSWRRRTRDERAPRGIDGHRANRAASWGREPRRPDHGRNPCRGSVAGTAASRPAIGGWSDAELAYGHRRG